MQIPASISLDPLKARFAGWFLLALLLHVLLVLVPIQRGMPTDERLTTLSVNLQKTGRPKSEAVRSEAVESAPPLPARRSQDKPSPAPPAPQPEESPTPAPPAAEPTEPSPVSAAALMDSVERLEWRPAEPRRPRRLGEVERPWVPENWRSGVPRRDSRFDGRALPERVEIVDRWLASDGSHHVLVETPAGEMLCGRAAAWDPMQPLVEPVMMFRRCGPGGSTFGWPDHYRSSGRSPAGDDRR